MKYNRGNNSPSRYNQSLGKIAVMNEAQIRKVQQIRQILSGTQTLVAV